MLLKRSPLVLRPLRAFSNVRALVFIQSFSVRREGFLKHTEVCVASTHYPPQFVTNES